MKIFNALLLLLGFGLVGACNTISGAGEDLEAGGRAISDTADEAQQEITQ